MSTLRVLALGGGPQPKFHHLYSWEMIWKDLLESDSISGCQLIRKLAPALPSDFTFDFVRVVSGADNKGSPFIVFFMDSAGKLHIELMREEANWILSSVVTRAFFYAATAEGSFDGKDVECKMIPSIFLVDAMGVLNAVDQHELRLVTRDGRSDVAIFKVPFTSMPQLFPSLKGLTSCEDLVEVRHRVRQLYTEMGGISGYRGVALFHRCAALADHHVYTSGGARNYFVDLIVAGESELTKDALSTKLRRDD